MRAIITGLALLLLLPTTARAEFPDTLTMGHITIECRTVEEIRRLGLECDDIPWKDNAARLYVEAVNAHTRPAKEVDDALRQGSKLLKFNNRREEIAEYLDGSKTALALLKQADALPRCQFPLPRSQMLSAMKLPPLSDYQALGRLIAYAAAWEFAEGRTAEAVDLCLVGLRFGRRVGEQPFLISWLVGTAVLGLSTQPLDRIIATGTLDDVALKSLSDRLAAASSPSDTLVGAMRSERVFCLAMIEAQDIQDAAKIDWAATRTNLGKMYDYLDLLARGPTWEAVKRENDVKAFAEKQVPPMDPLTLATAAGFSRTFAACAKRRIGLDALRLRIALERFKLAKKAYPETLDALVPACIDKLPPDPFSGKPYGYRVEADGHFLFWSIGEDLDDQGGKGDPGQPWQGPDCVFTSRPAR